MAKFKLGIDIGGTFTDFVILDEEKGWMEVGKCLTTPDDPSRAVETGFVEILQKNGITPDEVSIVIHGTTLVTNTIIERKGAKTGLITTKGFRDVLEMGNEFRYELYDLRMERPKPLVPRHWRWGVTQRVMRDGEVLVDLDLEEVRQVAWYLKDQGVTAVAICLLHSYMNPDHENKILDLLKREFPQFHVSISSRVNPEIREYERTSTTMANAYVQPLMKQYLRRIDSQLKAKGFRGALYIMLSSGGITSVNMAEEFPIRLCESGPAAGALVSSFHAASLGIKDLISFDMGGTTAKICLIHDGKPSYSREFEAARLSRFQKGSGFSLKVPAIEMIEIGAGGGSVGYIDRLGLMKVGPESAGASPGPACYGFGGEHPTVTDAALLLGYLNPQYFLGGEMSLKLDAARKALKEKLADPLGVSVEEAAIGMNKIVTENMAMATRIHITEKGKDPRKYVLMAFGGAGPIHAFRIAEIMKLKKIICPAAAGTASALGLLVAPLAVDYVRSHMARLDKLDWEQVNHIFGEMENEGAEALLSTGVDHREIFFERSADMRYVGQFYEIPSPLPGGRLGSENLPRIVEDFYQSYELAFGRHLTDSPIQVLTWRLRASCPSPSLKIQYSGKRSTDELSGIKGKRKAYYPEEGEFVATKVYDRYSLAPGSTFPGPAIIEERESTTIVGFHSRFHIDEDLNLIIERE
ncbi:MAG: hydantoinase/oxoprolinase family protein [Deltaproteobacteria bacterium]|nr:hydantoinase/oxoprolinase family protein [Deltaproteobacteria bacterium]